ncbi:hypothetical protein Ancab_018191 [Ancistrocladus abbreviatus]
METGEAKSCIGYGKPPWKFKGSAVYQLHLVKSEVARALIPKEFRLVEAFGYTLGGFFLAGYDDSPAGIFDELVVIAGIVWNPPTSCAWAAKVLVNSNEACLHGRKDVGLPSHVARFSKLGSCPEQKTIAPPTQWESRTNSFLNMIGMTSAMFAPTTLTATQVNEINGPAAADTFSINLTSAVKGLSTTAAKETPTNWMGPFIRMSLPSFSGRIEDNPSLLKYSCQMKCRVRVVQPINVSESSSSADLGTEQHAQLQSLNKVDQAAEQLKEKRSRLSISVMLSKPIFALELNCMEMNVEAPLIISE